jgi:hypothetical protein
MENEKRKTEKDPRADLVFARFYCCGTQVQNLPKIYLTKKNFAL